MIKKYERFDPDFLMKIKKVIEENNLKKGRQFLLEYMNMYPSDEWAKIEYITLLRKEGNLEEAEQYINSLKNFKEIDFLMAQKYFVALAKGEYQKAYDLLPVIEKSMAEGKLTYDEIYLAKLFLEKQLGLFDASKKLEVNGYLLSQIADYSKEQALTHIYEHHSEDAEKENTSLFDSEIDINELFDQVQKRLQDESIIKFNDYNVSSEYVFEYPLSYEGCKYKYFKVAVIRDTTNIITMYPLCSSSRIDKVNSLNPIKKESASRQKVKRLSRIEKFNQKYSNFV